MQVLLLTKWVKGHKDSPDVTPDICNTVSKSVHEMFPGGPTDSGPNPSVQPRAPQGLWPPLQGRPSRPASLPSTSWNPPSVSWLPFLRAQCVSSPDRFTGELFPPENLPCNLGAGVGRGQGQDLDTGCLTRRPYISENL